MMKVASLCFEVCYPQRNALSVKKSKAKTGKIRHVSQDIRHLHEIPWGKGLWDTIRFSSALNLKFTNQTILADQLSLLVVALLNLSLVT